MLDKPKRTRGHAARRERILAAARELIAEKGYDEASLRAIARRAGFSPAGLYEYFESRDAILQTLSDEAGAQLRSRLTSVLEDTTGWAGDRMVRLGVAYIGHARDNPEDFQLLFSKHAGPMPGLKSRPGTWTGAVMEDEAPLVSPLQPMVDIARAGLTSGEFDPLFSAEEIAWGVWALAHGTATLRLSGAPSVGDADAGDTWALRAYIDGVSV